MLRRALASSRYIMLVAVVATFAGSVALILYEAVVVAMAIIGVVREGSASAENAKPLAIGLIGAVDVFLIAVAVYIISVGLYALFIDDKLPLPRWLEVHTLDDLKGNLVSVVIAVLAVLFLRAAVAWEAGWDLLAFGAAIALVVVALTHFLATIHRARKQ